jgi:serine O-acetyltransferase
MSELRRTLEHDLFKGRRVRFFLPRLVALLVFGRGGAGCLAWRRLGEFFLRRSLRSLAYQCSTAIERRYGCYLSPHAQIAPGLSLPHPTGIVIGEGVVIGPDCTIYQQVTVGGRRAGDQARRAYPRLANDVLVFAGAKIMGEIEIGRGAIIGANAVVLQDVPAGCTAVGVPARVIAPAAEPPIALHSRSTR